MSKFVWWYRYGIFTDGSVHYLYCSTLKEGDEPSKAAHGLHLMKTAWLSEYAFTVWDTEKQVWRNRVMLPGGPDHTDMPTNEQVLEAWEAAQ